MVAILRVQLLGEFRLFVAGQPAYMLDRARQQSLLAFLLLHRHTRLSRQQVAFHLWPDSSEAQAHTNLRKLVFQLRRDLPQAGDFLFADHQYIGWRTEAPYSLDVAELEQALGQWEHGQPPTPDTVQRSSVQTVLTLYPGELFPACYEEWILPLRRALHERVVNALGAMLEALAEQRAYAPALAVAEHLRRLDPLHEATYRQLMHLHALTGDRSRALRIYHECAAMLEQELGVLPATETQALYQHLLKAEEAPAAAHSAHARQLARIPLVGRQAEWRTLQTLWRNSGQDGARLVTLWGEAGVGKTRLVEELVQWAKWRPGSVAYGRGYAAEGSLAYAPLTEWLRAEALRPAILQAEPLWLAEVARLLPEVQHRHQLPAPLPMSEGWQRQRFYEALAQIMLAAPPPLLLVLDDLHWCDVETLAWLRYLLRFAPHAPLLVVATIRSENIDEQHPLHELRRHLQRSGQETTLEVKPLTLAETAALAAYLGGSPVDDSEHPERATSAAWAPQLYRETEGNPLFIVEMVRAGWQAGQDVPLPSTVQAVIATRLAQLSPAARQVTQMAATVGQTFTYDLLNETHEFAEDALVQALDELWRKRIVREQEGGYAFSHDKIREVAYGEISPVQRRHLHRKVAAALEHCHARQISEVAGLLAGHYRQAGDLHKTLLYLMLAGERAKQLSANQVALGHYHQALALAEQGISSADASPAETTAAILTKRATIYLDLYQGQEAVADFQRLLLHARQTGNRVHEMAALLGLVNGYYLVALDAQEADAAQKVRTYFLDAQALARALGDKRNLVLSLLLPIWHFWPELREQAVADSQQALALSYELGDEELILESKLAWLHNSRNHAQAQIGDEVIEELDARNDLDRRNRATFYLMWTHYNLGNYQRGIAFCEAGLALTAKLNILPVQYPTLKAFCLLRLGAYAEAWRMLRQEVADEAHRLGRAFKAAGEGLYFFEVGDYARAAATLEGVVEEAGHLRRGWLGEWARIWWVRSLIQSNRPGHPLWAKAKLLLAEADTAVLKGLEQWQALALVQHAEIALAETRVQDAQQWVEQAISIMAANEFCGDLAAARELQARILLQLHQPKNALAALDEAQRLSTAAGSLPVSWRIYATRGQTLEMNGNCDAAVVAWQTAAHLITQLAANIEETAQRKQFLLDATRASVLARAHTLDKSVDKTQPRA